MRRRPEPYMSWAASFQGFSRCARTARTSSRVSTMGGLRWVWPGIFPGHSAACPCEHYGAVMGICNEKLARDCQSGGVIKSG